MPVQIPLDLQPPMKAKQVPGIWLKMPPKEEELLESCALVGKAKDPEMLKKLEQL